ncbi:aspartate dehydrogenase [Candidatus Aerophobetes bacterium]|nr:aspartate dehydrogenase [Candidatus Aerophobetes bacterium]
MKVGLIGCGAIGTEIAQAIDRKIPQMNLLAMCDIKKEKAKKLRELLREKPLLVNFRELLELVDLVIEAASPEIVGELVEGVIKRGKDILVMSVGGMVEHLDLLEKAQGKNSRIYFPSGAIVGLDGVKAAQESSVTSVVLTTSKPPSGLKGAPYIIRKGINLEKIKEKTILFEGNCEEAVKEFPKNINVSAVLSLAGIGIRKTRVRIIVDPSLKTNVHHIIVEGKFGRLETRTENLPSPSNPKTSYLAALSAIATLKRIVSPWQIGT